jgi:hypothetical protein
VNQIANLAVLEWHDNLKISAANPSIYWPAYLDAMRSPPAGIAPFTETEIAAMIRYHALPDRWPELPYDEFLEERRRRMAGVVREAYERLVHGLSDVQLAATWPPSPAAVEHLLHAGETTKVELKSSLRADTLGRGVPPRVLEKVVARTVAGFMNAQGGVLVIGVDDDGKPLGLERDLATLGRNDLDGFQQALITVLSSHLGTDVAASVRVHLTRVGPGGNDVALVDCPAYEKPVFIGDGKEKEFYVRAGNTTRLMDVEEAVTYIARHWAKAA